MRTLAIWRQLRDAWIIVGITILFLVTVELLSFLAFLVKDHLSPTETVAPVSVSFPDPQPGWAADYQREFEQSSRTAWEPYLYWRRRPYAGALINVDENGIRRTASAPAAAEDSPEPLRVFMFGGSAMWGTGARDEFTIPSILARGLTGRGVPVEITNFGESGYVSTQGVVSLLRQLQLGGRPDLVIFYDGANDLYSAYQQRVAGIPQNEFNRVEEFNLSQPDRTFDRTLITLRGISRKLSSTRFLRWVLNEAGLLRRPAIEQRPMPQGWGPTASPMADRVVQVYQQNIQIVRALGEQYQFQSLFYWQPTVFDKSKKTELELAEQARFGSLASFAGEVTQALTRSGLEQNPEHSFTHLGRIFDGTEGSVFIDWCHVTESGNAAIASRIQERILEVSRRRTNVLPERSATLASQPQSGSSVEARSVLVTRKGFHPGK